MGAAAEVARIAVPSVAAGFVPKLMAVAKSTDVGLLTAVVPPAPLFRVILTKT